MNAIEALQPVTHVFQLFGLSVATPFQRATFPLRWILKCYSLLLNTLRIGIFTVTLMRQLFYVRNSTHEIYATIDIMLVCGVRLLEIVNSVEALFRGRKEQQLIENFMEIDRILMQRFNIDLKPNQLRYSAIKHLIIWFCAVAVTLGGNLVLTMNQSRLFCFYLTYIPPLVTASLTFFQIIIWADLIRYRLHVINRIISDLKHPNNDTDKTNCRLNVISRQLGMSDLFRCTNGHFDAYIFDRICVICDLHRRLWIQTNLVNERFKCSMVLNIGIEIISLVSNLYFTFVRLKEQLLHSFIMTVVYFMHSAIHIFHISMLSRTCHRASKEASNIAYGIHNNKYVSKNIRLSTFVCRKTVINLLMAGRLKRVCIVHLLNNAKFAVQF